MREHVAEQERPIPLTREVSDPVSVLVGIADSLARTRLRLTAMRDAVARDLARQKGRNE